MKFLIVQLPPFPRTWTVNIIELGAYSEKNCFSIISDMNINAVNSTPVSEESYVTGSHVSGGVAAAFRNRHTDRRYVALYTL
jgi:hypothetical protein